MRWHMHLHNKQPKHADRKLSISQSGHTYAFYIHTYADTCAHVCTFYIHTYADTCAHLQPTGQVSPMGNSPSTSADESADESNEDESAEEETQTQDDDGDDDEDDDMT
jgi:hypothetical protein